MNTGVQRHERECPWTDAASLHLLGHFTPRESQEYLEHLESCAACRDEFARAQSIVAEIDLARAREDARRADAPAPSATLRTRLLERIADETGASRATERGLDRTWRRWDTQAPAAASTAGFAAGMYAIASDAGEWERIGIDGIEVKRLATDPARRVVSMLIRMAPGTAYPPHRHAADEECLVLSGELRVGERLLKAGDYQKSSEGSIHPVQATDTGCLLFITSSQDDELVLS